MNKRSFLFITLILVFFTTVKTNLYSQMKFNAGMLYCNFNGDTLSFDLKTDLNNLYYMTMGGTADFGLIKIQWDDVKNPADVKTQTIVMDKGFIQDANTKISVIWADFYTNLPYVIKKGKLIITDNSNSTIKGTLEVSADLGGNPIIGEFIKGKKEAVLKNGYFEIKY